MTSSPAISIGKDATDIAPEAELHVLLDGYLGWEGVTSQVIAASDCALDILGKSVGSGLPIARRRAELRSNGTGTTMFEATPENGVRRSIRCSLRVLQGGEGAPRHDLRKRLERVGGRKHVGPGVKIMVALIGATRPTRHYAGAPARAP